MMEQNPDTTEVQAAEHALWNRFKRDLEHAGKPEAALYLQHVVRAKLVGETDDGPFRRLRFDLYQRLSDYSASYNARTGEQSSWYFSVLKQGSEKHLGRSECLRMAEGLASPPQGAILEMAQYEEQAGEAVFVACWSHRHNGAPVEQDFVQVLVNGKTGNAFGFHKKWHAVDEALTER